MAVLGAALLLASAALGCVHDPSAPKFRLTAPHRPPGRLSPAQAGFLRVPSNDSARASLQVLTAKPHVAGTSGDLEMARYVQRRFEAAGIPSVEMDTQKVLLSYPVSRSLELVGPDGAVIAAAPLAEAILPSDPTSDTWWRNHTFNGYSPSGSAAAPVIYANFGLPDDFAALAAAGVSVKGAVVLMRYGKCFRGLKAMNAESAGAVAALIYSDPHEDGFAVGPAYPHGPWRPESSVQRGSIQFISVCAGDPARAYRPHNLTVEQLCGKSQKELIPTIPVLPLSWGDALPLLRSLGGPVAPAQFQGALNLTYRLGPGAQARLSVENSFADGHVWNVIAKIPGTLPADQDQPILLGNHRDAWVYGAADPNSGTAQLIEVARGLGLLLKSGWRPLRSIVLCSWSGEEFGLLGSTAWGEVHGDGRDGLLNSSGLLGRAAAYLNVDTGVSGQIFGASGTASLGGALEQALAMVEDPARPGRSLRDGWSRELFALGSGSDYTVFIDHLGIPSLDMHFSQPSTYGVYHSVGRPTADG